MLFTYNATTRNGLREPRWWFNRKKLELNTTVCLLIDTQQSLSPPLCNGERGVSGEGQRVDDALMHSPRWSVTEKEDGEEREIVLGGVFGGHSVYYERDFARKDNRFTYKYGVKRWEAFGTYSTRYNYTQFGIKLFLLKLL